MTITKISVQKNKKKVFVAMSGGVDSSVAALLLKRASYDVVGVFMRCFSADSESIFDEKIQCAAKDAEDARRVAGKLKIPFYVWDFEKEYKKKVVDYMVEGYREGITPNPDVMCNREIKFGLFLKKALVMGADFVATGHYARIVQLRLTKRRGLARPAARSPLDSRPRSFVLQKPCPLGLRDTFLRGGASLFSLWEAQDKNKDQSYFLWTLTQEQLKHCLFPIGDYLKSEVRKIAAKAGLPTAAKKDSQGICFLGKVNLFDFLKTRIPEKSGDVLTADGKKIGKHSGSYFYTIGQRHLKIKNYESGIKGRNETAPRYVAEKDVKTNTIVVVEGNDNPSLYKKEIELKGVNFIFPQHSNILKNVGMSVLARVRYRQLLAAAAIFKLKNKNYKLIFDSPQKFIAPGQSAVFYSKKGEMLGGGIIKFSR